MKAIISLLALYTSAVFAVSGQLQNNVVRYQWQTQSVTNPMHAVQTAVVARNLVNVPNANGLRVHFVRRELAPNTAIRLTSVSNGKNQFLVMNNEMLKSFNFASPYLNGDKVLVEVLAAPGATAAPTGIIAYEAVNRVATRAQESICGTSDDRQPSQAKPIARMVKVINSGPGCTGTMISATCMVSAGHCTDYLNVAQFNVPLSSTTGAVAFPGPEDQYPLEKIIASSDDGIGNDWAVYKMKANPVTGKFPGDVQGFMKLSAQPLVMGEIIRITGYGSSETPKVNYAQQTHTGAVVGVNGSSLGYNADTMPGNSGSVVVREKTQEVVGIHTNGGCGTSSNTFNSGTSLAASPNFQKAINACLGEERALRFRK